MTREMIINELNNRGYDAEACNTIKNGVELEGIRILTDSNVAPVIYTERFTSEAQDEELEDVVSAVIATYNSNKAFTFDVRRLQEREFVLNGLYIGLQKASTEEIEKKESGFDGIESYLYIRGNDEERGIFSIKATKNILDGAGVSESEAWEQAEKNTEAESDIVNMVKIMAEMAGQEYDEENDNDEFQMYVITNKSRCKGAAAILNKKMLQEFGKRYHTDRIVVLPSSVHEMILVPYAEELNLDDLNAMVREVNDTQVDPTERLTNKAYIINI
jgi:hypothetical protein